MFILSAPVWRNDVANVIGEGASRSQALHSSLHHQAPPGSVHAEGRRSPSTDSQDVGAHRSTHRRTKERRATPLRREAVRRTPRSRANPSVANNEGCTPRLSNSSPPAISPPAPWRRLQLRRSLSIRLPSPSCWSASRRSAMRRLSLVSIHFVPACWISKPMTSDLGRFLVCAGLGGARLLLRGLRGHGWLNNATYCGSLPATTSQSPPKAAPSAVRKAAPAAGDSLQPSAGFLRLSAYRMHADGRTPCRSL
jgi:hypothetical protein